jgi:hypothetical protein
MKKIIIKYRWVLSGVLIGGIGGWCYWYFVGCASGTCPITAHPLNSTAYGMMMGGLFFSMFVKNKNIKTLNN